MLRPRFLGHVHGHVGVPEQGARVRPVERVDCNPDAAAGIDFAALDLEGLREPLQDLASDQGGVQLALHARQDHHEFVSAEARHRVALADALAEPAGDRFQQEVPHGVPEGVIDRLEAIQLEKQYTDQSRLALCADQGFRQPVLQQGAVG